MSERALAARANRKRITPGSWPWYSSGASHIGHLRRVNEDAWLDAREQGLWAVADGMGGHSRGDRASQIIVAHLCGFSAGGDADQNLEQLLQHLDAANRECREHIESKVMGSTVAILHTLGVRGFLLWAGDSRIYRYREGVLAQLTDDHSLVQELHRLGEMTAEEAAHHPSSNVITRAVGVNEELEVQVREIDVQAGDRYLLCSDGLFKDLSFTELGSALAGASAQQARDELLALALKRGGRDNVMLIVVQISTPPSAPT